MRGAAAVCAVAALLSSAPTARAETDADRFHAATDLIAQQRFAEAARRLVALADDDPDSAFADDALFAAGQLYEERLGDPARALALYERLTGDYPDSRAALAASRRAASLRADLGPNASGAEALARFNDIRHRYPERPPAESIAMMRQLLADYPDWPGAPRAVLWLAEVHHREGRLERAAGRYRELGERWPDSEVAFEGYRGAAQVAILRGRLDEAERAVEAMAAVAGDDPPRLRAVESVRLQLGRERTRATWYVASFAVLAAALLALAASLRLGAGSWRSAARALARPPTEALYFAPVAAVLIGAALTGHEQIAPATAIILIGGLAIAWLSGAGLAAAPARWRAALHAALSAIAVVAVIYIAVHRTRLIDLILQTVRFGPDH